MDQGKILVVDDDPVACKNLVRLLKKEGHSVYSARSGDEALAVFSRRSCDCIISDLVMDGMNGMELLEQAKHRDPDVEVILVTGYASIPSAILAVKEGAFHYLQKPHHPQEVRHLVKQALEKRRLKHQVRDLEAQLAIHPDTPVLIGQSQALLDVKDIISEVAKADCNVLFTGESGTGKELAASLLHHQSQRQNSPYLAINCGAFSEELLTNELFGHEKDAFTGATTTKIGLLETANQGTLFFDEVGDMPQGMQVKLLRAIQEKEIIRVGGTQPVAVDVRIVAATNKDLKKSMSSGFFRQDLYFRLNVVSIRIPPLRERKEDIPLLARYFLEQANKKSHKPVRDVSDLAMRVLTGYDYPGNVRELENIIERAVALSREEDIQVHDLPPDLLEMELYSFEGNDSDIKSLKDLERDYIQWVLAKTGRNKTKAARLLGIDRASLWRRLKKYEIES